MSERYDVLIVGAGFAGLHALHRLRGAGFSVLVVEAGEDVGGTWFHNRYPGARCDGESLQYSYSWSPELEQDWEWSERFATQPEILRYLHHVADRFDLRRDVRLGARVVSTVARSGGRGWTTALDDGTAVESTYVLLATGCLSAARTPEIPGLADFCGEVVHTGDWRAVDLAGKRVGVIGTGSSGVQVIPLIAAEAASLTVFQRTPNFTLPARNRALDPAAVADHKARYPQLRERQRYSGNGSLLEVRPEPALSVPEPDRRARYEEGWERGGTAIFGSFSDLSTDAAANETLAEFLREKIRGIVRDPATAAALTAQDYPVGAKRACIGTDFYETFNLPHVSLVDLRTSPLETVPISGYDLDVVVLATGFDAMTGSILAIDVRGTDGRSLRDDWAAGPHSLLGLAVHGYPNLFTVTGPGSPSVLGNVVVSIEQHVGWIADHLEHLRAAGLSRTEATSEAQERWVDEVNEAAASTLMTKASSWYLGANVPGKPQVFMPYAGGFGTYRRICDDVAAAGYEGFTLS